jgi:hypothetical protein
MTEPRANEAPHQTWAREHYEQGFDTGIPFGGRYVLYADATPEDYEERARNWRDYLLRSIAHERRLTKAQLLQIDEWLQQPATQKRTRRWG